MPRWRFWERPDAATNPSSPTADLPRISSSGLRLPPPRNATPAVDPAHRERVAALRRRREGMLYDLERAKAANRPDNPWQERIALLGESLETIETDAARLAAVVPLPLIPLPPTPIKGIEVATSDPVTVTFQIGEEQFRFAEETDWDQRGGPVVRGDLRHQAGDAAALVPLDTPAERWAALAAHFVESVIVFATDLRDRAIVPEPLVDPTQPEPTLAALAEPCRICGNWREWGGTCETCAARAYQTQQLNAEAVRLATEREAEANDRHKWAERLPLARRRLADVETEIAKLESGAAI